MTEKSAKLEFGESNFDRHGLPSASRESFLAAMGRIFSLVAIITTDGPAGRFAITVNSATSASADPPIMLACINRRSPVYDAIVTNELYCLNVLAHGQEHLSDCFAGRPRDGAPFDFNAAQWSVGSTGAPILTGAVASFDCSLLERHDIGSHTAFFGRVLEVREAGLVPLIYGSRLYTRPDTPA